MSVSNEEREDLHNILDALINARISLERIDPEQISQGVQRLHSWVRPRAELCWNASLLVRRLIGPDLHRAELSELFETRLEDNSTDCEVMAALANALRSFLPLFMEEGRNELSGEEEVISKLVEDLMGIYWGDEPRFFSIQPRRQGQHKRLYRLNALRLSALDWDKYLAVVGMAARERHRIISDAFRTDWEAIRKWAALIERQYGFHSWPPPNPDLARVEYSENSERIMAAIRRDGDAYWREKSAA
jgi:hypothetical protein